MVIQENMTIHFYFTISRYLPMYLNEIRECEPINNIQSIYKMWLNEASITKNSYLHQIDYLILSQLKSD